MLDDFIKELNIRNDFIALAGHIQDLYDEVATHIHDGYALLDHEHDYALPDHVHKDLAYSKHEHDDYAYKGHSHTDLANAKHDHAEYSLEQHEHSDITKQLDRTNAEISKLDATKVDTDDPRLNKEYVVDQHAIQHVIGDDKIPLATLKTRGLMSAKHVRDIDTLKNTNFTHVGGGGGGSGSGVSAHGDLTGLTSDDHTQYLLADGTRELDTGFSPSTDQGIATKKFVDDRLIISAVEPSSPLEGDVWIDIS